MRVNFTDIEGALLCSIGNDVLFFEGIDVRAVSYLYHSPGPADMHSRYTSWYLAFSLLPGGIEGQKCHLQKPNPDLKSGMGEIPLVVNIAAELACQLMPAMSIRHLTPHIIPGISVLFVIYYPMISFLSPLTFPDLHHHPTMSHGQ